MGLAGLAFLAATIAADAVPLRQACDHDAPTIAHLHARESVDIRFALTGELGPCYKVAILRDGKTLDGYVPATAVHGRDEFDQARAAARNVIDPPRPAPNPKQSPNGPLVPRALQSMQAARFEEALELLELAMRNGQRDASVLALAGTAALRADRAQDAVNYWQASLALAPNPLVERQLQHARREVAADQSQQRLVGIRFHLRYDDRAVTAEQARALLPILDQEWARVSEQLGCRADERMAAIIQSREDYLRTTNASEWSGGQYSGRIHVALLEPAIGERTRQAFTHEIVHACLAQLGNWPAWLHEGLAQKLAGQTLDAADRALIQQLARTRQLPSLNHMGPTFSRMSARHAQAAYATALAAAELLSQHYGLDGVRSLLQSPDRLPQIAGDLDRRLRQ